MHLRFISYPVHCASYFGIPALRMDRNIFRVKPMSNNPIFIALKNVFSMINVIIINPFKTLRIIATNTSVKFIYYIPPHFRVFKTLLSPRTYQTDCFLISHFYEFVFTIIFNRSTLICLGVFYRWL